MRYAELAVTTNFSFLRGGSHPRELVATAHALGLAAVGIADRNTFAGVVRAYDAAKKLSGIKLLVGTRLLTDGNCRSKKGECHFGFAEVLAASEGQMLIALPPDEITPAFIERLTALARAAPGRAFLAGVHRYRGDEPRRLGRLEELG